MKSQGACILASMMNFFKTLLADWMLEYLMLIIYSQLEIHFVHFRFGSRTAEPNVASRKASYKKVGALKIPIVDTVSI